MRVFALGLMLAVGCGGTTPEAVEPETVEPPGPIVTGFRFTDGAEQDGAPTTRVLLVIIDDVGRRTEPVGTFLGPCSPEEAPGPMIEAASCWWGGEQAELTLVRQGNALVVIRDSEEEVLRVALPGGADVISIAEANALEEELGS